MVNVELFCVHMVIMKQISYFSFTQSVNQQCVHTGKDSTAADVNVYQVGLHCLIRPLFAIEVIT